MLWKAARLNRVDVDTWNFHRDFFSRRSKHFIQSKLRTIKIPKSQITISFIILQLLVYTILNRHEVRIGISFKIVSVEYWVSYNLSLELILSLKIMMYIV